MEYIVCCLCCMGCFACGAWAARGWPGRRRKRQPPPDIRTDSETDALSRDIAALLAYTVPGKEEPQDEDEANGGVGLAGVPAGHRL